MLVPGSRLVLRGVGVNWTRSGFVRIAQRMGAIVIGDLEDEPGDEVAATEPISDLDVTAGPLVGTVVEPEEVPLAIDELPLVALLGCFAEGETVVRGAQELRLKETDRIATVVDGLSGLGRHHRGHRGRLRGDRHRRPARRAASARTATTAWPCSAPSPAWPRARASRSTAWRPPTCPIQASWTTWLG